MNTQQSDFGNTGYSLLDTLFHGGALGTLWVIAASHDDDDDNRDPWRREENEEVICSLLAAGSVQVHNDNCLSFSLSL